MSHLFVLVRMTAHINIRGRIKFATPPVLCSVLLFHNNILNLKQEGRNTFHHLFVPRLCLSEAKGMIKNMILEVINKDFSIYNLKEITAEFPRDEFTFVGITDNELSIISETQFVPDDVLKVESGWKCFRIAEDASFEKYGMIAFLANIISVQKASTLAVGTFDTDYLFIKTDKFDQVVQALKDNDCTFI